MKQNPKNHDFSQEIERQLMSLMLNGYPTNPKIEFYQPKT
jgi:hypothetical protein